MTDTITTETAIIRAIIAKPDDDQPRIVYADWLEENDVPPHNCGQCKSGQIYTGMDGMKWIPCMQCTKGNGYAERAEFIRDCVLLGHHTDCPVRLADLKSGRPVPLRCGSCAYCVARRRAEMFYALHSWADYPYAIAFEPTPLDGDMPTGPGVTFIVRRGFIAEVRCTEEQWVGGECDECEGSGCDRRTIDGGCKQCSRSGHVPGIGQRIAQTHPVERVVTEKRPTVGASGFAWWNADRTPNGYGFDPRSDIAGRLYELIDAKELYKGRAKLLATEQAALDAYSRAAIEWARRPQSITATFHYAGEFQPMPMDDIENETDT